MVPGRMVLALGFRISPTLVVAGILPSFFGPRHQLALLYIDALLGSPYNHGYYPHKRNTSLPLVLSPVVADTHRARDTDSPVLHLISVERVSLLHLPLSQVIGWNHFPVPLS